MIIKDVEYPKIKLDKEVEKLFKLMLNKRFKTLKELKEYLTVNGYSYEYSYRDRYFFKGLFEIAVKSTIEDLVIYNDSYRVECPYYGYKCNILNKNCIAKDIYRQEAKKQNLKYPKSKYYETKQQSTGGATFYWKVDNKKLNKDWQECLNNINGGRK